MPGLSFREYLNIKTNNNFSTITFDDLLNKHQQVAAALSQVGTILKHFEEYLLFGYYPMVLQNRELLYTSISQVIEKTIYEDISQLYNLKTSNLVHLKRILNFLASILPGNIKTNNLARHFRIDNKTTDHYLDILNKTGLIRMLCPLARGNQLLTKPAKIYLENATLMAAINTYLSGPVK